MFQPWGMALLPHFLAMILGQIALLLGFLFCKMGIMLTLEGSCTNQMEYHHMQLECSNNIVII